MKFKNIYKLIECRFELYFKGSYVGEYTNNDDISNIDWVLECNVISLDIEKGIGNDTPILSIQLR